MFTGIIQGEGRIARLDAKGSEMRLHVSPAFAIPNINRIPADEVN